VICASRLPDDPTAPSLAVPAGRDVAKIVLRPAAFPFRTWRLARPTGEPLLDAAGDSGSPVLNAGEHVVGMWTGTR
jgi:hypothetical protein